MKGYALDQWYITLVEHHITEIETIGLLTEESLVNELGINVLGSKIKFLECIKLIKEDKEGEIARGRADEDENNDILDSTKSIKLTENTENASVPLSVVETGKIIE